MSFHEEDEDFNALLDVDPELEYDSEVESTETESEENPNQEKESKKKVNDFQKNIEFLLVEYEKAKAESKEKQMHAKDLKDEIINMMNEKGVDEVIVNGLDSVVLITITYPEREVLDKKSLAQALGIKQAELSKPEVIISLTKEGKITTEMIENFTITEERMQFNVQEYNPNEE